MRGFYGGLIGFIVLMFISCHQDKSVSYVTVSGQIINPSSNAVLIYNSYFQPPGSYKPQLDSSGYFSVKIPLTSKNNSFVLEEGANITMFYAEPGDSIYIFLNSDDFDGSLSYSGDERHFNNLISELIFINSEEAEQTLSIIFSGNYKSSLLRYLNKYKNRKLQLVSEYLEAHPRLLDNPYKNLMLNLHLYVTQWMVLEEFNTAYPKDSIHYEYDFPFNWHDSLMPMMYDLPFYGLYYFNNLVFEGRKEFSQTQIKRVFDTIYSTVKSKDLADAISTMLFVRYTAIHYPKCNKKDCEVMWNAVKDKIYGVQYKDNIRRVLNLYRMSLPGEPFTELDSLLTLDSRKFQNIIAGKDDMQIYIVPEISLYRLGRYDFILKNPNWASRVYFLYRNKEDIPVKILTSFFDYTDSLLLNHHLYPENPATAYSPVYSSKNFAFIVSKDTIRRIVYLGKNPEKILSKLLK